MRKVFACVLAVVQLLFAAGLLLKAGADEKAAQRRRAALLTEGAVCDIGLEELNLYLNGGRYDCWFTVRLADDDDFYSASDLYLDREDDGLRRVRGPKSVGTDAVRVDRERFFAAYSETSYAFSEDNGGQITRSYQEIRRPWYGGDSWFATKRILPHCALRARVLDGDVLFAGIVIEGTFYAFEVE